MKTLFFYLSIIIVLTYSCSEVSEMDDFQITSENCATPDGIQIVTSSITANDVTIEWNSASEQKSYEIEYGKNSFTQGSGTTITTSKNKIELQGLSPESNYDFYLRSKCDNQTVSEWIGPNSFTTEEEEDCWNIPALYNNGITSTTISISWALLGEIEGNYEIEYGLKNFILGNGDTKTSITSKVKIESLEVNTKYDIYVRTKCSSSNYGNWFGPETFKTDQF